VRRSGFTRFAVHTQLPHIIESVYEGEQNGILLAIAPVNELKAGGELDVGPQTDLSSAGLFEREIFAHQSHAEAGQHQ